ncbi:hypothetical protein JCM5350_000562 [Sporobolomyces pararoseus]
MSTFPYESLSRQTGLPHLPLELLRKIAKELTSRSHLQSFALGSSLLSSDYHLVGKTRLSPFPDLVRRLVLERDAETLSFSPVDLAFLLHDLPNTRSLDISGQFTILEPPQLPNFHNCFRNIDSLKLKTTDTDYSHETLRILLDLCRNVTKLDLGADLLTLESPFTPWHFAPPKRIPSNLVLPSLRQLTLRSPLYLALPSLDLISKDALRQVRTLEIDLAEESVGRIWYSGEDFPREFFDFFGSSIEHLYFNFPLYSKRSNSKNLAHLLSGLTSLRTLSFGSVSAGAANLLVGIPSTCNEILIHNEDGSPDWMGLHRFFLEVEGESNLDELRGKRIWMDQSDCRFCDENFQREVEIKF